MDNSDNMENVQKIGELSKVSLLGFVDIDGVESIPSVYSGGTDSLHLLASTRMIADKDDPTPEYLEFKDNPNIGIREIFDRYMKGDCSGVNLKPLKKYSIPAIYEKFGDVKGITQDCYYTVFLIDSETRETGYSPGVKFIPVKELKEMMAKAGDPNLIHMDVDGQDYRINRGITYALGRV